MIRMTNYIHPIGEHRFKFMFECDCETVDSGNRVFFNDSDSVYNNEFKAMCPKCKKQSVFSYHEKTKNLKKWR